MHGGKKIKNRRLKKRILEKNDVMIHTKIVGGSSYVKSALLSAQKASSKSIREGVSSMVEKGRDKMSQTKEMAGKLATKAKDQAKYVLTGKALSDISHKLESEDNVDQQTCINKQGTQTFCNFSKGYEYGKKQNPKENGLLKKMFYGEPDDEMIENATMDAKKISALLQQKMINVDTGEISPEKIKSFMEANMRVPNMKKLVQLMHMLELLFPNAESKSASLEQKQKQIDVSFPWTVYGDNVPVKDKLNCLWNHLTKQELSDREYQDDIDSKGNHKCFYCPKCTLRNTATKVFERFFHLNEDENTFQFILLTLHDMLIPYFDVEKLSSEENDLSVILMANMMNKDLNIYDVLNHSEDSYDKSKQGVDNLNAVGMNKEMYDELNSQNDLVSLNGRFFHIRSILLQCNEMKRNAKSLADLGDIDNIQSTYQILKQLDLVNIITNIIIQVEYARFFSDDDTEEKHVQNMKDYIEDKYRSAKLVEAKHLDFDLGIDTTEISSDNMRSILEETINKSSVHEVIANKENMEEIFSVFSS